MFLLDSSTFLICGGAKKEILLFTKIVPQADCCDLGDKCTINQADLIIPVPWEKCEDGQYDLPAQSKTFANFSWNCSVAESSKMK